MDKEVPLQYCNSRRSSLTKVVLAVRVCVGVSEPKYNSGASWCRCGAVNDGDVKSVVHIVAAAQQFQTLCE